MPVNEKDFVIKRNDTLPALKLQLSKKDCLGGAQPFPLSGVTGSTFTMISDHGNAKVYNKQANILSQSGGTLQYEWDPEDTDESGIFRGEFQLKYSDGRVLSIPRTTPLRIEIIKDINPFQ